MRIILCLLFFLPFVAGAEDADVVAGKASYDAKCLVCHGVAGASTIPTQPILAAQHADYLIAQMELFRSGHRDNPVMMPLSADLSDTDIANISHYLAEQTPVIVGANDAALAKQGEKLYRGGDLARNLPACTACHGAAGAGIEPLFPRIAGQYPVYTTSSLLEYANGKRPSAIMQPIAAQLTAEEIKALAAYISGLSY